MADNEDENGLITISTLPNVSVTDPLNPNTVIVNDGREERVITDEEAEDILQQAIQDAQEFGEEAVTLSYVTAPEEGETDPNIVAQEIVNNVSTNETSLVTNVSATSCEDSGYDVSYAVVADNGDFIQTTDGMALDDGMENIMLASTESQNQNDIVTFQQTQSSDNIITLQSNDFTNSVQQGGLNVTLVPANQNSVAPIGSSQNPIRIVQQGNQYTPVQQLTAEQLQQIMHVVQEQQLAKSADSNNGSSILYNPQTNTRIVYRVIYPSELHKSTSNNTTQNTAITIGSQTAVDTVDASQVQRRTYKKRIREDEDDKVEVPELSKEEKEERKKHRPRTRSGRVSKPPKHMVKDYKHIHVLDWDEDYDDSDGGYSDFKISDEDKRAALEPNENSRDTETDGVIGVERVKNYKCEGCDKAYIGQGGLRRHYQLNPTHGTPSEDTEDTDKASSINSNNNKSNGSVCSFSEDSNTQDSLSSQSVLTPTSAPLSVSHHNSSNFPPKRRGPGRPSYNTEGAPSKRRTKLQELVRQCTDDELMEIVLPRLAKVVTLWEFLMMKLEKGGKATPKVEDIFHEFELFQKQVSKTCQDCLVPVPENSNEVIGPKLQVDDSNMASCLGLKIGQYQVKPLPTQDKSFHYKFLTTEPRGIPAKRQNNRRTIEIVTPDELIQTNSKKPRMTTLLNNSVVSMAAKTSQNTTSTIVTATNTSSSHPISSAPSFISSPSKNLLSEPFHTSVSTPSVTKNTSQTPNMQTVILTNSAPSTSTYTTLNGGTVVTLNGNQVSGQENYRVQIVGNNPVLNPPTVNSVSDANNSVLLTNSAIPNQPFLINNSSTVLLNNSANGNKTVLVNSSALNNNAGLNNSVIGNTTTALNKSSVNGSNSGQSNNSVQLLNSSINSSTQNLVGENNVIFVSNSVPSNNTSVSGNNIVLVNPTNSSLLNGNSLINGNTSNAVHMKTAEVTSKNDSTVPNIISPQVLESAVLETKSSVLNNQLDIKQNILELPEDKIGETESSISLQNGVLQNGTAPGMELKVEDVEDQGELLQSDINELNNEQVLNADQIEGELITPDQIVTSGSNIYQTEDGILIIQNPDGTTFQLQGAEGIPIETVQALLAMDGDNQYAELQ